MFGIFKRRRGAGLAAVEADITAFGEALAALALEPAEHAGDTALLADYERALDSYEQAKRAFVGDRDLLDAEDAVRALDAGRHALACVDARLAGRAVPEHRPLCFFDARHGPSVRLVVWAPPGEAARPVPVCAADAVRLEDGLPPIETGRAAASGSRKAERALPDEPDGAAPFDAPPPGTPQESVARRKGNARVELSVAPREASVLVVRFSGPAMASVDIQHRGSPRSLWTSGGERIRRVVFPLAPGRKRLLTLQVSSDVPWAAWPVAPADVPPLRDGMSGHGMYLFRHDGGPVPIRVRQKGRGSFALLRFSWECELAGSVVAGSDTFTKAAEIPGPGLYLVRASAGWVIDGVR
ncbi:hypothetical protein [Actinomadura violacea]|uniref:Uncharacterized protein n=1 Tax=Actinomadura violacea TaxID=2819934 RepID=A0ABS3RRU4_9ACTN|nr:hypothetical protein [Actinomadura violacea]MBO2458784.1 hypothetical protein [Actinomadura violacea]